MIKGHWKVNVASLRRKIGEGVKQKTERIAQQVVDSVIEDSPVFTGKFRASWNVSEGAPIFIAVGGGDPANPHSAPKIRVRAKDNFPLLYITNGQPYGQILESGSSDQAPNGMVAIAIGKLK